MAKQVQVRRGTTAQNSAFTGLTGEITLDTESGQLRAHDGATAGGRKIPMAGFEAIRQTNHASLERWYCAGIVAGGNPAFATLSGTVDTLRVLPVILPNGGVIDRIGTNVTVAAGAGGKVRFGIYDCASLNDLYPTNLLLDAGEEVTDTTGVKSKIINFEMKPGKLYWLAILFGVAAGTVKSVSSAALAGLLGLDSTLAATINGVGFSVARAYGALPTPFPAGAAVHGTTAFAIFYRCA